jgi:hypothetical protein
MIAIYEAIAVEICLVAIEGERSRRTSSQRSLRHTTLYRRHRASALFHIQPQPGLSRIEPANIRDWPQTRTARRLIGHIRCLKDTQYHFGKPEENANIANLYLPLLGKLQTSRRCFQPEVQTLGHCHCRKQNPLGTMSCLYKFYPPGVAENRERAGITFVQRSQRIASSLYPYCMHTQRRINKKTYSRRFPRFSAITDFCVCEFNSKLGEWRDSHTPFSANAEKPSAPQY